MINKPKNQVFLSVSPHELEQLNRIRPGRPQEALSFLLKNAGYRPEISTDTSSSHISELVQQLTSSLILATKLLD